MKMRNSLGIKHGLRTFVLHLVDKARDKARDKDCSPALIQLAALAEARLNPVS
jgi:hypothetical protein